MGLKQIKDCDRITFLNEFTKEILLTIYEKERIKKEIKSEKIRRIFVKPQISEDEAFKRFLKIHPAEEFKEIKIEQEPPKPSLYQIKTDEEIMAERKPTTHRQEINNIENLRQVIRKKFIQPKKMQITNQKVKIYPPHRANHQQNLQTQAAQSEFKSSGYKKIEALINDPTIQSIECSGPEKNIIVKRYNNINLTRIVLTQQEIADVIDEFSKQARIPIVGGILKAAVGNMITSAVVSEFVGSKFVITKKTPYSLIYK